MARADSVRLLGAVMVSTRATGVRASSWSSRRRTERLKEGIWRAAYKCSVFSVQGAGTATVAQLGDGLTSATLKLARLSQSDWMRVTIIDANGIADPDVLQAGVADC